MELGHAHQDMYEGIEHAAEVGLPSRAVLHHKEPHRKESRRVVVNVQKAHLHTGQCKAIIRR
eukprot:scaffold499232_cov34-Prasinocladus_malaysianus.AAC.2